MGRLLLALRAFWRVLTDGGLSEPLRQLLDGGPLPPPAAPATVAPPPMPSVRHGAIDLLALLQRQGRLLDFLKEDLSGYSDAQIGAAARDIHRECNAALEQAFAVRHVYEQAEGSALAVPAGFDATRLRLTGSVAGAGPFNGTLRHGGWFASKIELPTWTGPASSANVIAPAEVEL
jgi:hypothetical protein